MLIISIGVIIILFSIIIPQLFIVGVIFIIIGTVSHIREIKKDLIAKIFKKLKEILHLL